MRNLSMIMGFLLALVSPVSQASLVTWQLNSVAFGDGGTVSGSFTFDASTNTYASWNITTTVTLFPYVNGFQSLTGATYVTNAFNPNTANYYLNPNGFIFKLGTVPPAGQLVLNFASPLTNAGGVISLQSASETQGFNNRSMAPGIYLNGGTLGTVVSAVPLPASLGLMLSGLGLVGTVVLRRRT
jgi:hypothetical protein